MTLRPEVEGSAVFSSVDWDTIHRDWNWNGRNYTDAWHQTEPPQFDQRWIRLLESLFQRQYRDSRCLHPAWQLLEDCNDAWAVRLREDFLAEFPQMLGDETCPEYGVAQAIVHQDNFARCPRDPSDDGKTFRMGAAEKEAAELYGERPQHEVKITAFHLQRMPVSNIQFELFDPPIAKIATSTARETTSTPANVTAARVASSTPWLLTSPVQILGG